MIKKYKPTSPGIRTRKTLVNNAVKPKKRVKKLFAPLKGSVGKSRGRISVRYRVRGAKKHYRIIDFKRNKKDIIATVAQIEYDPNRGPNIALLNYADGEKRYILAPEGLKAGMKVITAENAEHTVGNCLPLKNIPSGLPIHNIEINPGKGGQMVRGAGNSALILAREGGFVNIKLPSGEVKKVNEECYATIGSLGNADHRHTQLGKAGKMMHKGRRPHVRGVAIANPSDHPHGSSYKDRGKGHPKTPWGKPALGKKTRKRKHTDRYIVKSRKKK